MTHTPDQLYTMRHRFGARGIDGIEGTEVKVPQG